MKQKNGGGGRGGGGSGGLSESARRVGRTSGSVRAHTMPVSTRGVPATHMSNATSSSTEPAPPLPPSAPGTGRLHRAGSGYGMSAGEVRCFVEFDFEGHEGKMLVSIQDGHTATAVVAHCCAELNARLTDLSMPLASAGYMLELVLPTDSDTPRSGYLYGKCDLLMHPGVARLASEGRPLIFSLLPLPESHPNGMYFEDVVPSGAGGGGVGVGSDAYLYRGGGGGGGGAGSVPYSTYLQERSMLEQALGDEVERDLSQVDWCRPFLGAAGGDAALPRAAAAQQASSRVQRMRDRGLSGAERAASFHHQPQRMMSRMASWDASAAASASASAAPAAAAAGEQAVAAAAAASPPPPLPADASAAANLSGLASVLDSSVGSASHAALMKSPIQPPPPPPPPPPSSMAPLPRSSSPPASLEGAGSVPGSVPAGAAAAPSERPKSGLFLPSKAAELLRDECDSLRAALTGAQGETRRLAAAAEAVSAERDGALQEVERLRARAASAEGEAEALRGGQDELRTLRHEKEELAAEVARLAAAARGADERAARLEAETISLQKELTRQAKEHAAGGSASLEKLLPTLLAASTLTQPPPPPPPAPQQQAAPVVVVATTSSPLRTPRGAASPAATAAAAAASPPPDTPHVDIHATDSLGTIVAKLTGKPNLGHEVDTALQNPLLAAAAGEGGSPSPHGGEDGDDDVLQRQELIQDKLAVLTADLERLDSAGAPDGGVPVVGGLLRAPSASASGSAAATRGRMLRQVSEIRSLVSVPDTPYSHGVGVRAPSSSAAASVVAQQAWQQAHMRALAGSGGSGGGPGSPGGPRRGSGSVYSHASSMHGGVAPSGRPFAMGTPVSTFSVPTRPPGL